MSPEAKQWLDARETAAYSLLDQESIVALSDEALTSAERKLTSLTTTNCGWAIYAVRDVLLQEIARERYRRKVAAARQS